MNEPSTQRWRRVLRLVPRLAAVVSRGQGTTQRFLLLVVLFLAGSMYMFSTAFERVMDPHGFGFACELAAGIDTNANSATTRSATGSSAYGYCIGLHTNELGYQWLPIAATVLVILLSLLHYALYPWWQKRRRRIVPVERADPDRAVRDTLAVLKARASVTAPLTYLVNRSASTGMNARVFGHPGNYAVCLDLGLIAQFERDPGAFEATILHELSHIRNRDIGITYLTVAIWHVFVLFSLTPFALAQAFFIIRGLLSTHPDPFLAGQLPAETGDIVLAAFLVLLVYLSMADILGVREYIADTGAVALGADKAHWIRRIEIVPREHSLREHLGRFQSTLRPHPSWESRSGALMKPRPLLTARATTMFATGMATQFLPAFQEESPLGITYGWLDAHSLLPAAVLTTAIAGFSVWHDVTVELKDGRPAPSGLRAGLWLGLGQFTATLLTSFTTASSWSLAWPWPLTLVAMIIAPAAVLWWISRMAALLYGHHRRVRAAAVRAAVIATATAAFAWTASTWLTTGQLYFYGNPYPISSVFANEMEGYPHTFTTELIAATTGPYIDLSLENWGILLSLALWITSLLAARPRRSISTGLWCGLFAAFSILLITWRAHGWDGHSSLTTEQNYYVYDMWIFAILLCAPAAAAIITGAVRGHDPVSAMTAAAISEALGATIAIAVFGTDGCISPITVLHVQGCALSASLNWGDYSIIFIYLMPWLGMFTLAAAAASAVITRAVRLLIPREDASRQQPMPSSTAVTRPVRLRVALTGLALAGVVLCALSVPAYVSADAADSGGGFAPGTQDTPATLPSTSPRMLGYEMSAWLYLDGERIMNGLSDDAGELLRTEQGNNLNNNSAKNACSSAVSFTNNARSYLPPPNSSVTSLWASIVNNISIGARECLAGINQRTPSETQNGIYQIYESIQSLENFVTQADTIIHGSSSAS